MQVITDQEFSAMERLLAGLLTTATCEVEETRILALHARVTTLYERSAHLRRSKMRLQQLASDQATTRS